MSKTCSKEYSKGKGSSILFIALREFGEYGANAATDEYGIRFASEGNMWDMGLTPPPRRINLTNLNVKNLQ